MKFIRKFKIITAVTTTVFFAALSQKADAQQSTPMQQTQPPAATNISDATLKKFVDINKKMAPHQQQAETQMVAAIQKQGLKPDRFNQILMARQKNDKTNAGATAEELGKFNTAAQNVMSIQKEIEPKITKVITDEGMKIEEFQQIATAYQSSPELQQKVNTMMQAEQKEEAPKKD